MKKILLIILLTISLIGKAQFYNNYHYKAPTATMSINSWDASSANITYTYKPNGCKIREIRLDIYANGVFSRSEYFSINNAVDNSATTTIYGLSGSTTYTFYLWVYNCDYVDVPASQFTTPSGTIETPPTVLTSSASNISYDSFTANGTVTNEGSSGVTSRGFQYWLSQAPENVYSVASGSGSGSFNSSITGLYTAQLYKYRAYATNSVGTSYGSIVNTQLSIPSGGVPTVTTTPAYNITVGSATTGGNVTNDGGVTVTERGVYYSTSPNPSTQYTPGGAGVGTYTLTLSYLSPSTTYYYRAYAKNSYGTGYGAEYSFTTLSQTQLPTVVTNDATSILAHGATLNGNVTNQGSSTVSSRGFVYSMSDNTPELGETGVTNISNSTGGTGSYSNSFFNGFVIPCNSTIYYRAYAINSSGTAYGDIKELTTSSISLNLMSVTKSYQSSCDTVFAVNQASSEDLCDILTNPPSGCTSVSIGSKTYRVTSATIGNPVYNYQNCLITTESFWGVIDDPYPNKYVIHVENGYITYKSQCYP